MKTTDLIPLILYQLVDGDKYGYEIVKQIEDGSNGNISIKQPTLYSVLKKLEQGKFISSYWQDSEIGGKRHYYKLEDNGRAQLGTYPSFAQLISDIIGGEDLVVSDKSSGAPSPIVKYEADIKEESVDAASTIKNPIEDNVIVEKDDIKPIHIDLTASMPSPTANLNNDSFIEDNSANSLFEALEFAHEESNATEFSIDTQEYNDTISSPSQQTAPLSIFDAIEPADYKEEFNKKEKVEPKTENLVKAVEKVDAPSHDDVDANKLYDKLSPNTELMEVAQDIENEDDVTTDIDMSGNVKYLNYVNLATDKTSIKRKKAISRQIVKMSITCLTLLIMLVSSIIIASKYSFTKLYYIGAIVVILVILFYPMLLIKNISKLRLKYCCKSFKYSICVDFFIKLSLFLSLIIAIFAYNLNALNSLHNIFKLNNFANFIAPIMFSFAILLDFAYSVLLYKKYTK